MSALEAFSKLAVELQRPLSLDETMQIIVGHASEILCTERTSLRLLDASRTRLLAVCRHGRPVHAGRQEEFRVGEGLMGWIAANANSIITADAENDPRFTARPGMQIRIGSFLGVPLMEGASCIGVVSAVHADRDFFTADHLQQLSLLAALCAPRVEAARLKRLARIDPLTGALNRRGFESELPPGKAAGEPIALSVVIADIDRFKAINDTHGHLAGDAVLRTVTNLLASVLRETDAIVRYGGEEFLLVLPNATVRGAASVADRARAAIERVRVPTETAEVALTASFGVAQRRPDEARDELLRRADAALFRAKNAGRNRVEIDD